MPKCPPHHPDLGRDDVQHAAGLWVGLLDGEGTGVVDAVHDVGAVGAVGAEGAVDAEDVAVDVGGGVPVVEDREGAVGADAEWGGVHEGAAEDAAGAEGVGAVVLEVAGAADVGWALVGAGPAVVGAVGVGTVLVVAVDALDVAGVRVGAVGAVGVVDGGREGTEAEGHDRGVGIEAVAGRGQVAVVGDEVHGDGTVHPHSYQQSASFGFEYVV